MPNGLAAARSKAWTLKEMTREKQINFRVSDEDVERFERVAAHYGLGVSAMIRMLVKEKHDRLAAATSRLRAEAKKNSRSKRRGLRVAG